MKSNNLLENLSLKIVLNILNFEMIIKKRYKKVLGLIDFPEISVNKFSFKQDPNNIVGNIFNKSELIGGFYLINYKDGAKLFYYYSMGRRYAYGIYGCLCNILIKYTKFDHNVRKKLSQFNLPLELEFSTVR